MNDQHQNINVDEIDTSIRMLKQHLDEEAIAPLISALEAIKKSPQDSALLGRLSDVFAGLGIMQGAVLTYAPYLAIILTGSPLDDLD